MSHAICPCPEPSKGSRLSSPGGVVSFTRNRIRPHGLTVGTGHSTRPPMVFSRLLQRPCQVNLGKYLSAAPESPFATTSSANACLSLVEPKNAPWPLVGRRLPADLVSPL